VANYFYSANVQDAALFNNPQIKTAREAAWRLQPARGLGLMNLT
jgi:hypothetical protein